jgi:hypothetical protein
MSPIEGLVIQSASRLFVVVRPPVTSETMESDNDHSAQ